MSIREGLLVELAGRGGAGKTTIAGILRESGKFSVLYVNQQRFLRTRIRAALQALKFGLPRRLSPRELVSLFRKCSSVEQGMAATAKPGRGPVVIDEGPMRGLRDIRCCSFAERRAWWSYAQAVLERMAQRQSPLLLVHFMLDEPTRQLRHHLRNQSDAASRRKLNLLRPIRSSGGMPPSNLVPPIRFAMRVASARVLGSNYSELRLSISPDEPPEEVARRITEHMEMLS